MTLLLIILIGFTTHQGLTRPGVKYKYMFSSEGIRLRRQWVRLISPAFLHANWGHFGGNAFSLYLFGRQVEAAQGPDFFIGLFFMGVVGGSLLCLLLHRDSEYQALGASGGALGVVFACILLNPGMRIGLLFLPIYFPGWVFAIGYVLYTLYGVHGQVGGISHEGHWGGLLSGVLVAWGSHPGRVGAQTPLLAAILILSAAGIWYFHVNPGRVPGYLRFQARQKVNTVRKKRSMEKDVLLDKLLDKVAKEGLHSLTPRERRVLEDASKERKNRS